MLLEQGGRGHFHRDPHEEKMILDKLGELNSRLDRPDKQRIMHHALLHIFILFFYNLA